MNARTLTIAVAFLLAGASTLMGQTPSLFGKCSFWQDQRPADAGAMPEFLKAYRVGFAHAFVFGTLGDLPPREPEADPQWARLQSRYNEGLIEALQRPAFLVDAFDQKCGDYRNRRVELGDIGLLILLEVGGVPSQGIERALEILRAGGEGAIAALLPFQ